MQAQESAKKLYEMGLDAEKIAQAVGYAVETVKGWLGLREAVYPTMSGSQKSGVPYHKWEIKSKGLS